MATSTSPDRRDAGSVLVLTLILTVVLAALVIVLAQYATTGLKTSAVTDARTATNADGAAAINWAIEELVAGRLGESGCADAPASHELSEPSGVVPSRLDVTLTCSNADPVGDHPTFKFVALTTNAEQERRVEAVVEFDAATSAVRTVDWEVDDEPRWTPRRDRRRS
jgi:Tfp pilus assembly protein PilX